MTEIIDKASGTISLAELSKYNGKTEFENMKWIVEFLQAKAEFYDRPQKMIITFKKEGK